MNRKYFFAFLAFFLLPLGLFAYNDEARWAIDNYHRYYGEGLKPDEPEKREFIAGYRNKLHKKDEQFYRIAKKYKLEDLACLLQHDGRFSDLDDSKVGPEKGNAANSGGVITEAFNRLWFMSAAVQEKKIAADGSSETWADILKSICHYGTLEISRPNNWTRFHSSCFAIPRAAVGIYFHLLPQMDAVESGEAQDELLLAACDMLKTVALQTWTQPVRNDGTDLNVVQPERFRKHVWWVGGNGLGMGGYRSVFQVAFMFRSVPMLDLLAEVAGKGISATSQATYETSFWNEGFTVDGAGWGHGRQCLIWGYPIDGTSGALRMLGDLKNSPWHTMLTVENKETMLNYFRGGNYYYYKGYCTPCLDRNSMAYTPDARTIPYDALLRDFMNSWKELLSDEEMVELRQLQKEVAKKEIVMEGFEAYNGTRWFFNNDDLIKKNSAYYIMVNMASSRCDGIESAAGFADCYNFYTADGSTMFEKSGDEYRSVIGGFDVTAFPGVTAREGMEKLVPVTNWRGYCSSHNFAGASAHGGENAVAGFIFEKMNGSEKKDVNDRGNNGGQNEMLYGVKAYKSYFMLGDYMIALGAGITNEKPDFEGHIRTTLDQTAHVGEVRIIKGKKCEWVAQEGKFAYSVLPEYGHKLNYLCETKPADWVKMNASNRGRKNMPATVDILRLWIDHGQSPVNDRYGYVVYAGEGVPASKYTFKVLRNDTEVQAVMSDDGETVEAVFYKPASLKAGKTIIKVDTPCTLLLENTEDGTLATICDPQMDVKRKAVVLRVNGKAYSIALPEGEYCGASVSVKL